jgi:hypothetical protein
MVMGRAGSILANPEDFCLDLDHTFPKIVRIKIPALYQFFIIFLEEFVTKKWILNFIYELEL